MRPWRVERLRTELKPHVPEHTWVEVENAPCSRVHTTLQQLNALLMRLNLETRRCHAEVDEPWLDLLSHTVTRTDYLSQLVRTFGFVAPFEAACRYTPGIARLFDGQLSRAGLIAQDLLTLGLAPVQVANVPQCASITTFRSVAEALGWMYVVERATLLQDGIRRHLLMYLSEIDEACAYLAAFDGRVSDHWNSFGRMLDRVGDTPESADEIIAAANNGFGCAQQWFRIAEARRSTG